MEIYISSIQPYLEPSGALTYLDLVDFDLLPKSRQEKIKNFVRRSDKARALVAGLLLRKICHVTEDEHLTLGPQGKPYLKNHGKSDGLFFNLSHSGKYVVLVTAQREVGIDIEEMVFENREQPNSHTLRKVGIELKEMMPYSEKVARAVLTPEELKWLKEQNSAEAFYRLWTAKESVMKAFGLGFSLPPESFSVLPMDESPHLIMGRKCYLKWQNYEGHMICTTVLDEEEKLENFLLDDLLTSNFSGLYSQATFKYPCSRLPKSMSHC